MIKATKNLRFAPLIRVSTETQEKAGESLRTQKKHIEDAVNALGGMIPDYCWQYSGQEHATAGWEREKLGQLLKDASEGKFDAVIVADASRWSRDNQKSKEGLQVLRDNNIRFFVSRVEYDLYNPEQVFFLGMSSEIGEYQARTQNLKSITNRIERAKRGIPTSGKLPFGRTFDKKTGKWGIDQTKADEIKWAASQYLQKDRPINDIAKTLGMNASNLWKVLRHRSGSEWTIDFRNKDLNIDETVTIQIPPLLDQLTIEAIAEKAKANKTYTHGEIKNRYLLSRVIFCADCGYSLFGQTNKGGRRYYRHGRDRERPCSTTTWVVAEELEAAVLAHLFKMFGDINTLEQAILAAIPNSSDIESMQQEKDSLAKKLVGIAQKKKNVINSIANGTISDEEASELLNPLRSQETQFKSTIHTINQTLENIPSQKQIERKSKLLQKMISKFYKDYERLKEMTYEDKKHLIRHAFAGTDKLGNRLGVYVQYTKGKDKPWHYTIKGILPEITGDLPMEEWEAKELLGVHFEDLTEFAWG